MTKPTSAMESAEQLEDAKRIITAQEQRLAQLERRLERIPGIGYFTTVLGAGTWEEVLPAINALNSKVEQQEQRIAELEAEISNYQSGLLNPAAQVYFRAGLIACREYMAQFVASTHPEIAASIRANWWPRLGRDYGPPRKNNWNELTEGEYGTDGFRIKTKDQVSPTLEALPIALAFLEESK